ncbi:MAG: DNA mismatch repair protein MutS, partial [Desulfobacterales bacterium]|nr:DNA mismatch repair protein MutS [Desulfobacterales bacterium]
NNLSKDDPSFYPLTQTLLETPVTYLDDKHFYVKKGEKILRDQFNTLNLKGFGCENMKAGLSAAGALLFYVLENQKQKIEHLSKIETYTLNNFLMIDNLSYRNLEITNNLQSNSRQGTLISIIDKTVTAMGARLLKRWTRYPLIDTNEINQRLDAIEEATLKIQIAESIRENLKSVYDLERLGSRISMGHANARDLVALKVSIFKLPDIMSDISTFTSHLYHFDKNQEALVSLAVQIDQAIREDAPPTIHDGGIIRQEYNDELDRLIRISKDGKGWLANLEMKEKSATGINSLKVKYNKVFGYYIEIPKTQIKSVPSHYARKQTLVNAERYITDELKNFESEILSADERRNALELQLFTEIKNEIIKHNREIQKVADHIAVLDCLLGLAIAASQNDYIRPKINVNGEIIIEDGRHPVIEKMISGERFVPNSLKLDNYENQVLIITGPNMAGKSTILRQVALLILMAQMGSFIPAKEASISITDRIFTRVGALDNIAAGQSTFMVEMQETANILNNSTQHSLIIMDEIGRGTSTFDGLSIAWAVAEFLHDLKGKGVKTLFATHYHELTDLSHTKERVKNYNISVKEWNDEIIFLRKMVEGGTNRSYGIQVARLAGIPDSVLKRAKNILSQIELGDHQIRHVSPMSEDDTHRINGHTQLDMFRDREIKFIRKLQEVDISKMTPLDALNFLNELTQKAKDLS